MVSLSLMSEQVSEMQAGKLSAALDPLHPSTHFTTSYLICFTLLNCGENPFCSEATLSLLFMSSLVQTFTISPQLH